VPAGDEGIPPAPADDEESTPPVPGDKNPVLGESLPQAVVRITMLKHDIACIDLRIVEASTGVSVWAAVSWREPPLRALQFIGAGARKLSASIKDRQRMIVPQCPAMQ
jgi:hypothetical protein